MVGSNKDKGTRAETAVVRLARELGFPHAERRALAGGKDRGDLTGIPGVVIQVKDVEKKSVGVWQKATLQQAENDKAFTCILVVKVAHKNTRQWDAYIPAKTFLYECNEQFEYFSNLEEVHWVRMNLETAFLWLKVAGY